MLLRCSHGRQHWQRRYTCAHTVESVFLNAADSLGLIRIILAYFCHLVYAQGDTSPNNETEAVCHPFGRCEPCPEDAVNFHSLSLELPIDYAIDTSYTNPTVNLLATDASCIV